MVMIGMPHSGAMAQYEPVVPAFMGQHMIGSKMGDVVISRDIPWMTDLYAQGRLKLERTGLWPLDARPDQRSHRRHQNRRRPPQRDLLFDA